MEDNREEGHLVKYFFRTARFRYHLSDDQVAARDQIIDDNFCQFQERFQIFYSGQLISLYIIGYIRQLMIPFMAFEIVERINVCKKCKLVAMSRTSCSVKLFNLNHLVHYTNQTKFTHWYCKCYCTFTLAITNKH